MSNVECRSGCLGKSGMRILSHDACSAGIRPEGPPVNRPGRQAGKSELNKMSAEGAALLYKKRMSNAGCLGESGMRIPEV